MTEIFCDIFTPTPKHTHSFTVPLLHAHIIVLTCILEVGYRKMFLLPPHEPSTIWGPLKFSKIVHALLI